MFEMLQGFLLPFLDAGHSALLSRRRGWRLIFLEPVEAEFFHESEVLMISFGHKIGFVMETKIALRSVYESVLLDFPSAF